MFLKANSSTPSRKDSEEISKSRIAINEEKVNKMKDQLNYFKDKFEKNEEIKLGKYSSKIRIIINNFLGENGSIRPLVKQHIEKLNRTKSVLPTPQVIANKADETWVLIILLGRVRAEIKLIVFRDSPEKELVNFYYMWKKKVGLKKKINGLTSSSKVFDLDADPGKKKDGKIAHLFF